MISAVPCTLFECNNGGKHWIIYLRGKTMEYVMVRHVLSGPDTHPSSSELRKAEYILQAVRFYMISGRPGLLNPVKSQIKWIIKNRTGKEIAGNRLAVSVSLLVIELPPQVAGFF